MLKSDLLTMLETNQYRAMIRLNSFKVFNISFRVDAVTPKPNCIINFMGLYACYYLSYFKCIKL